MGKVLASPKNDALNFEWNRRGSSEARTEFTPSMPSSLSFIWPRAVRVPYY